MLVETWVYVIPSGNRGMSHCPESFSPQATATPSLLRSTVWWLAAETWVYVIPSGNGGMSHFPKRRCPEATATPSLLRSTVWLAPAETIGRIDSKDLAPSGPNEPTQLNMQSLGHKSGLLPTPQISGGKRLNKNVPSNQDVAPHLQSSSSSSSSSSPSSPSSPSSSS